MKFSYVLAIIVIIVLAFTLFMNVILPTPDIDLLEGTPTKTTFTLEEDQGTNPGATVTLIEFGDFKCPFCGQMHPDIKKLLNLYPDNLNYVYKHFPADEEDSARASLAAECAREQDQFIPYINILFERQLDFSYAKLQTFAAELKLNQNDFVDCMENFNGLDRIDNDIKEGKLNGVKGTPTVFINNRKLEGIQSFESLKLLIEQELIRVK